MEQLEGMTSEEAMEEIHSIFDDEKHPFNDPDDPGYEEARSHVEGLYRIVNGEPAGEQEEQPPTGPVKTHAELKEMLADPRYGKDEDYTKEVDEAYKQAFPDEEEISPEEPEEEPYRLETMRTLESEWGDELESRIDNAQAGMIEIGRETGVDLERIVDAPLMLPDGRTYRMGNDPTVIKIFEAMGRKLGVKSGADGLSFDFNSVDVNDKAQVKRAHAALRTMIADYRYQSDPTYRNRVDRLYRKIFPGSSAER
jgi:hypothetical protein